MSTRMTIRGCAPAILVAAALWLAAFEAAALDGYQDRKGVFAGLGVGGGAAFVDGETGGEFMFDAQIGGGATKRLTFALDLDTRLELVDGRKTWAVVPGPEANIFLGDGFFIRVGVGLGFIFPQPEEGLEEDFTFAFDGSLGVGYEFFLSSNVALDIAVEADYFAIDDLEDMVTVGFTMGLRLY